VGLCLTFLAKQLVSGQKWWLSPLTEAEEEGALPMGYYPCKVSLVAGAYSFNRHVHRAWKNLNEVRENPSRW
jgi:hypothetical protein